MFDSNPLLEHDESGTEGDSAPEVREDPLSEQDQPAESQDYLDEDYSDLNWQSERRETEQWNEWSSGGGSLEPQIPDQSEGSLRDHLFWQINLGQFSETDLAIANAIVYALDEDEKSEIIKKLNGSPYEIGRFKGLGEMPPSDLKETTMNKKTRSMIRVNIKDKDMTHKIFEELMGKNPEPRFKFITEKAIFVKDLDI